MKAAPPVRVMVGRSGAVRGGVSLLVALAAGATTSWVAGRLDVPGAVAAATAIPISILGFWFAFGRFGGVPQHLSWNGQAWFLAPADRVDMPAREGRVRVMIDAGAWMLIRFDAAARPGRVTWLAAVRAGQGPGWHGLRCAVYSPPPSVGPDSVGAVPVSE
ncbi:MAG: hypothetical protein AB7L28_24930 [Kofleriaceae bacterium]